MSDVAIRVENLSKMYKIGGPIIKNRTLRDTIAEKFTSIFRHLSTGTTAKETLWALQDVSFNVRSGKAIGIIGRNGAGKSTLLKILSRVTEPTKGFAEIHGRVGSLLEVGTGFHPELSGRENILLNGAILGMKKSEIDSKFDEIVDFSEIGKFIDTPVKRYSTGMYLRLAFAVAAHLEPEILVVDEVLAVGDAEFQRKCLGKMNDVAKSGRTILFVSHNMSAILRLTEEAVVLDKGKVIMNGPSSEAVDFYLNSGFSEEGHREWQKDDIPLDAKPFHPIAIRIVNPKGVTSNTIRSIEPNSIEFEYRLNAPIKGLRVGFYLQSTRGEMVFTSFDTDDENLFYQYGVRPAGTYISRCKLPPDFLNDGRYVVGVNASSYLIRRYFQDENVIAFTVDAAGAPGTQWVEKRNGLVRPRLAWEIEEKK